MEENLQQRPGERITMWILLAFSLFALVMALQIPKLENLSSSGVFPIFTTSVMIASAVSILWKNRKRYNALPLRDELQQTRSYAFPNLVIGYTAILLAYVLLTAPLHFLPSTYLFLAGSFLFLKADKLWKSLVIAAVALAIIYVLFQTIFQVILW
jgi:putative tricarboxylic transport membrane protein